MQIRSTVICMMTLLTVELFAQKPAGITYERVKNAPAMQWECPEIEKYTDLLYSLQDKDEKTYARKVRWQIDLGSDPGAPDDKYISTQALFKTENQLFDAQNLLNHIANWMKSKK